MAYPPGTPPPGVFHSGAPLPPPGPVRPPEPDPASAGPLKILYLVALLGGIGAFYYYFVSKSLSESALVKAAPMCVYPFVFGAYGLLAERGLRRVRRGEASSLGAAFAVMVRVLGALGVLILGILMLPLFLLGAIKNSLIIAIIGAAFWAGLLWFFFTGIFPSL